MSFKKNKPLSRSLRVYQKFAIGFVIVSFILLLFVLYLSVSAATIRIIPSPQVVSTNLSVDVAKEATLDGQITGYVIQETITKEKIFYLPQGGATPIEDKASGTVTLINETDSDQTLVATTRLMSEEGVLFRIDETVIVPAQGQVDIMAHADEQGLSGEIGPTQFIIPGLAESLQDDIYAVSVEPMTGGVNYVRILEQSDINNAVLELEEQMLDQAESQLQDQADLGEFDGQVYTIEEVESISDQEVGAEVGSFTVKLTSNVIAVYYDKEVLENYALADLQTRVSDNYSIAEVSEDGVQVEIRSSDPGSEKATLNIYIDGVAIISESSDVLDRDRLVGRSSSEVITILEASDLIEDVSVIFTPFWLKRVPTLQDHIKIQIEY